MKACPNCKSKRLDRDVCTRCGCELATLAMIEKQAYRMARNALICAIAEDSKKAEDDINNSLQLLNNNFTRHLKYFIEQLVAGFSTTKIAN